MNSENPSSDVSPNASLTQQQPSSQAPTPPKNSFPKNIFLGVQGLRPGWRVLLFYATVVGLVFALGNLLRVISGRPRPVTPAVITPRIALINEGLVLFGVLAASAIFARIERRSLAEYGLPGRRAFGAKFWEGLLWGFALMSAVLVVLRLTGNFYFGSLALPASKIPALAAVWATYFIIVGVAEELAFRGYPLFILARSRGFWPSALVLAAIFGGIHLSNSGENWVGAVSIVVVALMLAFTLRRTGDLWFAIGMHAAWDWAESFFYGVPDSGISFSGHMLNPSFRGSKWMTGGSVGPEASLVTLLGYGLVFVLINFRFPQVKYGGSREENISRQ
jgi:uncharacterized protein